MGRTGAAARPQTGCSTHVQLAPRHAAAAAAADAVAALRRCTVLCCDASGTSTTNLRSTPSLGPVTLPCKKCGPAFDTAVLSCVCQCSHRQTASHQKRRLQVLTMPHRATSRHREVPVRNRLQASRRPRRVTLTHRSGKQHSLARAGTCYNQRDDAGHHASRDCATVHPAVRS